MSDPAPGAVCSAKACRIPARHAVVWNNPKVHTTTRRKVWVACDEHRETLRTYVDLRGFLIEVIPMEDFDPSRDG